MERKSSCCERRTVAKNGLVTVESCDCGVVHLTLRALTLRFDVASLVTLRDALDEAITAMSRPKERAPWHASRRTGVGSC